MTEKAKEILIRSAILAFYIGGFLLLFSSCASRQDFSNCVKDQIDTATENWTNHPGPGDGRDSREILRHYIVYWCFDKGANE